jgi:alpha-1,6-mannosyltransferase
LLQSKDPVGIAAANNGVAFAEAIKNLLNRLNSEQTLRSRCHHQAENFPWSSTISQMLSLSPQRRLRVA